MDRSAAGRAAHAILTDPHAVMRAVLLRSVLRCVELLLRGFEALRQVML
jgi:hypothetical protein